MAVKIKKLHQLRKKTLINLFYDYTLNLDEVRF